MPRPLHTRQPSHPALNETLGLGLELALSQAEVVNSPDTQDAGTREAGRYAVHEGAAGRAKEVGHLVARGDRLGLTPAAEVLLAPQVPEILVVDGEVGCEHGCRDLATVCAVANEGVDETRALGWLRLLLVNVCVGIWYIAGIRLTNASWTAPQKQVAVASSSVDQPSSATVGGKLAWALTVAIFEVHGLTLEFE